jgi:hypothetical protein
VTLLDGGGGCARLVFDQNFSGAVRRLPFFRQAMGIRQGDIGRYKKNHKKNKNETGLSHGVPLFDYFTLCM